MWTRKRESAGKADFAARGKEARDLKIDIPARNNLHAWGRETVRRKGWVDESSEPFLSAP